MGMIQMALNDIACSGCIGRIKKGVKKYRGVERVTVIPGNGELQINYNENVIQVDELKHVIQRLAFKSFD